LKEFDVAGLVVNADESLTHLTFDSRKQAVVFGSEGHGLSAQTLGLINRQISIPMKNSVDSLNVAQCASIVFWALSQRVKS
jgi:tRNA G18 (ribose-2'-O)-methylase SpoU